MLCGSPSPQYGVFSGCGQRTWLPDMEGSWEYTKTNIWNFTMEQLSIIYFKLKI
jgi:hypothetical protein